MSSWVWVLIAWGVLAVGAGVVVGLGIRAADRRELGREDSDDEQASGDD